MDRRKHFLRKAYGLNGFDTFFSHFSTEFLPVFVVCIVNNKS